MSIILSVLHQQYWLWRQSARGAAFTLPNQLKTGKLGGFLSTGAIGAAIEQVRAYCVEKSAQFAAVTNGSAWIIFPALRTDGVPLAETQARIFRSLDDIQARFVEFWELLSRQRVIEGSLQAEYFGEHREELVRRPISLLREPGYRLGRNSLYPYIESAIVKALTDEGLLADRTALENCYVKTAERVKFDARLDIHVADLKPELGHPTTRVRGRKNEEYLDEQISLTTGTIPRFFLILGPVGAGKSMFLNYTRQVSSRALIEKRVMWLYVDFKKATESDVPRKFLYQSLLQLIEQNRDLELGDWKKTIQPAYKELIEALQRGPLFLLHNQNKDDFNREVVALIKKDYEEVEPYVDRLLKHAASQRPGFLVVDNVDQIEDATVQGQILSEALAIAQKIRFNIIMSLRDSTYLDSRHTARFDAFEFESIYVDPPSVLPVLSRRFAYAKTLLSNQPADIALDGGSHIRVPDLSVFIETVASSLLSDEAAQMLDVLSANDIRRGLSLTRQFLASGHVTADQAVRNLLTDRQFRFPRHEVFKGAVLGNRKFYREEESLLPNLFCSKLGVASLQLLRMRIVHFFVTNAATAAFEGCRGEDLIETLSQMGISRQEIEATLSRLVTSSVLRMTDGGAYRGDGRLLPTRLAAYLLTELATRFNYAEMCMLDATIHDEDAWVLIADITAQIQSDRDRFRAIPLRIQRVQIFVNYLKASEERWVVETRRRKLQDIWSEQILLNLIIPRLDADCKAVAESAELQKVRLQGYKAH
jgi:hypothetical protein